MKPKQSPSLLPDEEWNFGEIPEGEMEAAYWWEYCRSSTSVRTEVLAFRSNPMAWNRSFRKSVESVLPREVFDAFWAINRVSGTSIFPELPWQRAKLMRAAGGASSIGKVWIETLGSCMAPVNYLTREDFWMSDAEVSPLIDGVGFAVTLPRLGVNRDPRGDRRRSYLVTINWRHSDREISEALKGMVAARPRELPSPKRAVRLAPGGLIDDLLPSKALGWLSIWRRKQKCRTWTEFQDLYHQTLIRKKGEVIDAIDLRERYRKAEAILRHLNS